MLQIKLQTTNNKHNTTNHSQLAHQQIGHFCHGIQFFLMIQFVRSSKDGHRSEPWTLVLHEKLAALEQGS